ncbi:MAG: M13 family metallopeptidase [bacterium]|nr:M13 family metallopeptidase [bacterium]
MKRKGWGFDMRDIDKRVRPQDDFYNYANGSWFKKNSIPHDEARWGTFLILRKKTDQELMRILRTLTKKVRAPRGSEVQQIRDLYRSGMDMKSRNRLDAKPIAALLKKIESIRSKKDMLKVVAELHRYGIGVLWGASVDQDEKNSDWNVLHLYQNGLGLPDREYYLSQKPEQVRVRTAYVVHVARMFSLLGDGRKKAAHKAGTVLAIETKLAKASMKKEDLRDPHKTYHKMNLSALQKLAKNVSWRNYFTIIGAKLPGGMNVRQPDFMKAVSKLLVKIPAEEWRAYLTWHAMSDASPYLSERYVRASFDFYGKVLTGTTKMKPLWRRSLTVVNGSLGEALGKLYVEKHFPKEAKRKMDELVSNLFVSYEDRLKKLDWMSPATKKRALKKLHMMNRKIGYPDKWKSYKGLVVSPTDFFGNILQSSLYEHRRNIKKLGKRVDRSEWHMTPQTVNAYYNPCTNDIAFPAAILQPPYFGPKQDDALNYGAIGGVIGHEITHGFDDEGSKFDGHGDLKMWWSKADRQRFERKARVLGKQFDAYALHGVHVNGKLTMGENIADLGGYAIALDAYHRHLEKTGHTVLDGLTPAQRFFFGVALDWRQLTRPEAEKMLILTDPHAPVMFRTNGPASNLPEFYEAFGVKKGHKLYRAPKDRAKIW